MCNELNRIHCSALNSLVVDPVRRGIVTPTFAARDYSLMIFLSIRNLTLTFMINTSLIFDGSYDHERGFEH